MKNINKIKEIILKYKIYIICIIVVILSFVSIFIQKKDRENTLKVNSKEISSKNGKIAVYITGAVKNPGVYYINEGARVSNALDVCGGVLENADINALNLAKKLIDSDKLVVPVKQENKEDVYEDASSSEDVYR
ncbi:MAG: SLBB domain-containing protein [Clostridia bacterium]